MKKIIVFSLVLISGLILTSCDKWLEGQVIDYDLPEHIPALTVFCYLKAGDTEIQVRVGSSVSPLVTEEPEPVENVNVKFYKNGQLIHQFNPAPQYIIDTLYSYINNQDTFHVIDTTFTYLKQLSEPIEELATYKLEVSAPNYETAFSSQVVPQKPSATATIQRNVPVVAITENRWDKYLDKGDKIQLTINDPAEQGNCYFIELKGIYQTDWGIYDRSIYINKTDAIFTSNFINGSRGAIFSDASFNGNQQVFNLEKWYVESEEIPIAFKLELSSISKSSYDFYISLLNYSNSSNNPLAEPVIVHSNIENGIGLLFTLSETIVIELE